MSLFWSVTLFWGAAAVAVALALTFVLPFLLRGQQGERQQAVRRDINLAVYRDQMKELKTELANGQLSEEQFLASKLELETRAAEDALAQEDSASAPQSSRRLGFTLAGVLPIAAIGMYVWFGNPGVLTAAAGGPGSANVAAAPTEQDVMRMIEELEARTQSNPTEGEAWEALAIANGLLARWPETLAAYQKAYQFLPAKPAVMSGYAEALAMTSNLVLAGRPIELVRMALQADPNNRKGLELAGIHAYQNREFAQSVLFLDRLYQLLPPDTPHAQDILAMRNEAAQLAQSASGAPAASASDAAVPAASVAGRVEVAEALRARVGEADTIYLIARAGESGPPLAAARVAMGAFPLPFSLNDSMAMNPTNVLSNHQEVVVVARISKSGNPLPQPGDLEGRVTGVKVGAADVKLVIDRVLP
jgi:cytochrome c-type biogenesis protein CcmH